MACVIQLLLMRSDSFAANWADDSASVDAVVGMPMRMLIEP
jgi:hypothetical protein